MFLITLRVRVAMPVTKGAEIAPNNMMAVEMLQPKRDSLTILAVGWNITYEPRQWIPTKPDEPSKLEWSQWSTMNPNWGAFDGKAIILKKDIVVIIRLSESLY